MAFRLAAASCVALAVALHPAAAFADEVRWDRWQDHKKDDKWGAELQVGSLIGIERREGLERSAAVVGGVASVGFRRRLEFKEADEDDIPVFLALPTLGIALLPPSGVYGTEQGLDLHIEGHSLPSTGGMRWIVAMDPVFRVFKDNSRYRFPTVVQYVMPTIGAAFDSPGPGDALRGTRALLYVAPKLFPLGILITNDVGIELDGYVPLYINPDDASVAWGLSFATKLIVH
ncbi:MAG: hypothetical protein HOV80_14070 [Polyangiaceae bacterium]|nr:hypothetical protein [Polyangiaceae bacterium]